MKIPKVIHYCWFGGKPIPNKDMEYIESWKKYCPDYEIIKWDESNYDVTKCKFMQDAYSGKKWGFVPDYARLEIIYNNGGIYMDTDVEIIKPLDILLDNNAFIGFQDRVWVNPGSCFGAVKGASIIKELMDDYENISLLKKDGTFNYVMTSPRIQTKRLVEMGLKLNDKFQVINGLSVYPSEYFCPKSFYDDKFKITSNTYSIHHFNGSWFPLKKRLKIKFGKKVIQIIGYKNFKKLRDRISTKNK